MVARPRPRLASAALLLSLLAAPHAARAAGAIVAPGVITTDARIAIAVSSDRSTTWSSLRLDGVAGPVAMVVPTLDGSALDYTSQAFFDALEDATAPRVLPPNGQPAGCPGATPSPVFTVEGDATSMQPIAPLDLTTLATVDDVKTWAAAHGLPVSPSLATAIAAFGPNYRFVVVRFDAPGGPAVTKTLRAVSPTADPVLPLILSSAPSQDLGVTTWEIGAGRARIFGTEIAVTTDNLTFGVAHDTSNYGSLETAVLSDPERHVVESAGHGVLTTSTSLFDGQASIDSVIESYYARAAKAGDATGDPGACSFQAATALSQSAVIAHACPRADLGGAGTAPVCVEAPNPGEIDPAMLRCGGVADDLAVALSGLVTTDAWVTRSVLRIGTGNSGTNLAVGFTADPPVSGVLDAAAINQTGCPTKPSTTSSGSSGSGMMGAPPPSMKKVPIYRHEGCSAGGSYNLVGYDDVSSDSAPDAYYDDSTDGCSSSNSSGYDTTPSDSCASDTSSGSSSSSGCDSSSTDTSSSDSCDSGSSSDSCDSGSSGDSCSGGSGSGDCNCSLPNGRRKRGLGVRLSPLVYGVVLFIAPLRRRLRRRPRASRT